MKILLLAISMAFLATASAQAPKEVKTKTNFQGIASTKVTANLAAGAEVVFPQGSYLATVTSKEATNVVRFLFSNGSVSESSGKSVVSIAPQAISTSARPTGKASQWLEAHATVSRVMCTKACVLTYYITGQ